MTRTNRALTVLALSLALAAGTTAVALAAPTTEDLNGQRKALYQSELEHNLTVAQPAAEDQNDRLLQSLQAGQAERTQAAVEQLRAGERNLDPVPVVTIAPQPVPAARGIDPLAVLLLGLVGGLVVGAAATAAWTAASRRHAQRAVAA
ncbi:MAG TPA: hypothetical protein VH016_11040 [Actinomycetota bacterium]|jgi:hypothetical protein|nr:hypothetical protein [Actinomycetota bacterium]